jgi:hypothetical protein
MSRKAPSTPLNSWDWEKIHRQKRLAKLEKIQGLKALLEMHEANPDADHDYLLGLRARLRSAENQYQCMKV